MTTRVVVVGNGMAGSRLVQELRRRDPLGRLAVTVLGAESGAAYNRVLLSDVLAGKRDESDTVLVGERWYAENGVVLRSGTAVTGIDRAAREVETDDGERTPYDVLVLATGSRPAVPAIPGLLRGDAFVDGATAFRTLEDCRDILHRAGGARRAVVLGGGLLGLEAARGLARRGLDVELVHRGPHVLDRQLDPLAGRMLAETMAALGVRIRPGTATAAVLGGDRVEGVLTADGAVIEADLLVVSCGVTPEVGLARDAGLPVGRGILVDGALRSVGDARVHALGECAEHDGQVYGLVAPAWEQAAVLADVLTGADAGATYEGSRLVTRLKAPGVELAAMGESCVAVDDDSAEVVQYADRARGTYKKLVVRDGRLVGAILLGDLATVGDVTQTFDRGRPVPADRAGLLFAPRTFAAAAAPMADDATVCHCNGVDAGTIRKCWLGGQRSLDGIVSSTRASTGCGTCIGSVERLVTALGKELPERRTATEPDLDDADIAA